MERPDLKGERPVRLRSSRARDQQLGERSHTGRRCWRLRHLVSVVVLLLWACAALATTHVYDANGRLVGIINDLGSGARYRYDETGNLSQIERIPFGELAIFHFSPGRGKVGDSVRIAGQGFGPDAAQNVVAFNGVAALVVASSSHALTVLVPPGATSGPLSVTVGTRSITSDSHFIVDDNGLRPGISSVSPAVAAIDASVTVDGHSLAPVPGQTVVRVGARTVSPAETSNSKIIFSIPAGTGSGRVSVVTPFGLAASDSDLLIVPHGISANSIEQMRRVTVGGGLEHFSVSATGGRVAVLFEGVDGDYLTANFSSITSRRVGYALYGVDNKLLASGVASSERPTFHLPRLADKGTHLLVLTPHDEVASWDLAIERDTALIANGPVLEVKTSTPAQSQRFWFDVEKDTHLGMGVVESADAIAWRNAGIRVLDQIGAQVAYQHCDQRHNGCSLNFSATRAERYSVVITPSATGSKLLDLQLVLSDDLGMRLARNAPLDLTLDRPGQNGRLLFTGAAGEVVGLLVSGQLTDPEDRLVYYRIHTPDGRLWKSTTAFYGTSVNLSLPVDGEYTLLVDPGYGETVAAKIVMSTGELGVLPEGGGRAFQTSRPGQSIYFVFDADQGENLGLGIGSLVTSDGDGLVVNVYKPDGSALASAPCFATNDGCDLNLTDLVEGRYAAEILPRSASQTFALEAWLSTDQIFELNRHVASEFEINRRGQNVRFGFFASAGEVISLKVNGQATTPADSGVYYRVYQPGGGSAASAYIRSDRTLLIPASVTGQYSILVDPEYGATATAGVKLEADTLGAVEWDGSVGLYETTTGQEVSLEVSAYSGQNFGIGLSHLEVTTGSHVRVWAYRPNGGVLVNGANCYVKNDGCDVDVRDAVEGTYRINVRPATAAQAMKFRATLSSSTAAILTRDTSADVILERRGQDALLEFEGDEGETLVLQVAGQSTVPAESAVRYEISRPSRPNVAWKTMSPIGTGALNMVLPEAGTYRIWVDPDYGAAATAQVALSTGTANALALNGSGVQVENVESGQSAHFRFEARAGHPLGFAVSHLEVSAGTYVRIYAYGPNGDEVGDISRCYVADGGCDIDINSPASGTYSVVIVPNEADQRMRFVATLSSAVNMDLVRDVPQLVHLERWGQDGVLRFEGMQGDVLALQIAGQVTDPAQNRVVYSVRKPSGGLYPLSSIAADSGGIINMTLPESGVYEVFVDPNYGSRASALVNLSTGRVTGLENNGNLVDFETDLPGQTIYFQIEAAAGEPFGIAISDLVVSSGAGVVVKTQSPNGAVESTNCDAANGGCDVDVHQPASGTYSVTVTPRSGEQAMRFKVAISSTLSTVLAPDVTLALDLGRRGQDGLLTFQGEETATLALLVKGQTTWPSGKAVRYTVYKPSDRNAPWLAFSPHTGGALNMSLPEDGVYQVWMDPDHGAEAVAQLTLSTGTVNGLLQDGQSLPIETSLPGESIHFVFMVSSGQSLGLGLSDLVVSSGNSVQVQAYGPDGGRLESVRCYVNNAGCDVDIHNPKPGLHSITVVPTEPQQTMQFAATLSSSIVGTLERNVPTALSVNRRGQDGLFAFEGAQGELLGLRISGQTVWPGRQVNYKVYKPSDRVNAFMVRSPSFDTTLTMQLPEDGTYWVWIDPFDGSIATTEMVLDSAP